LKKIIIGGLLLVVLLFYGGYAPGPALEKGLVPAGQAGLVKENSDTILEEKAAPGDDWSQEENKVVENSQPRKESEQKTPGVKVTRVELSLFDQIKEHRVKRGENLWLIAEKYNIDVDTIIGSNEITNMNRIHEGEILVILPVKGILYKVNPGESIWSISRQFGISMDSIIEANAITNADLVKPGRLLLLPGAKPEFGVNENINKSFIKPISGQVRISSYYGMRWGRMHEGIDYAVSTGTPVRASQGGMVIYSGWASGYGNTVVLEHRKGVRTLYAHNSRTTVYGGQWVEQGQVIAYSGNTGRSTGPHLHFEIQINGKPVDPLNYLK